PGLRHDDGDGEEEAAGDGAGLGEAGGPGVPGAGAALPARARKQRYLSPVWEEEPELAEPAGAARGRAPGALSPDLLRGCGSPESPLFRSFFAEECLAIVRQLARPGAGPAGIEAEPLPLETTCSLAGERPRDPEPEPAERPVAPRGSGQRGGAPGGEQRLPQEEEGPAGCELRCRSRGAGLSPGAGRARPGEGDAAPRGPLGLQALALNALNLTVELQGSAHAGASLRQITFEISAANPLGSTVSLPGEREQAADQSGFKDSELDDLERSRSAYRTHELELVSNDSSVSLGSSSFATSTPLMGPAKFHFVTGSPLGDDLEQRDPNSSRRSMPRELSQAGSRSAAPKVTQSTMSQCGNLPEESCGKVRLKPPQRSTALPVSRSCTSAEGQAAIKSLTLAFTTPRASRSLALASFESRRASRELLRAGLPPRSSGIASEGRATRLSLGNSGPSMQKAAATGKTSQGSNVEAQPAAQLPPSGTVKRSAAKPPCSEKCPSSLRPPAKLPGLSSSSSRPLLMGSRVSLGPGILCMSKGAGAPGTKLPTHPGSRLRLMKPRPSSVQHTNGTLQPACSLPPGHPAARSSPQDKETETGVAKPGCNKLPVRRAATTMIPARAPHSRLRPTGRTAASPKRLPSPKRARLGKDTNSAAAAQGLEPSGGEGLSIDTEDKPALAVGQDLPSAGGRAQPGGNSPAPLSSFLLDSALESGGAAPTMQLPGQLLSQELQRVRRELQRVKDELAARDAQCEAYRRTISSLEAQLRAGSLSEGRGAKQDCALEGE
ncbi:neurofilament heavy polypeptide-like, partial [Chelydra serpentina]